MHAAAVVVAAAPGTAAYTVVHSDAATQQAGVLSRISCVLTQVRFLTHPGRCLLSAGIVTGVLVNIMGVSRIVW
jgi:hypothetical protein